MNDSDSTYPQEPALFLSGTHTCSYWSERQARNLIIDPQDERQNYFYPFALSGGFRRSGDMLYRPHCAQCQACIAIRIVVDNFKASRNQRRCATHNAQVSARIVHAECTDENFDLYKRYLLARHADGGMQEHNKTQFEQFLIGSWPQVRFLELREHGKLLAVAVTDITANAISAVYTFYEPELEHRSLGTLAILHQLQWASQQSLAYLYLGYWIENHPKMHYKKRFSALEAFNGDTWQAFV